MSALQLVPDPSDDPAACLCPVDAGVIMDGDGEALHRLWQVKTGRAAAADLSLSLPARLAAHSAALNRDWFEQVTGKPVTFSSAPGAMDRRHPDYPWMVCTLDGLVEGDAALFETRHVSPFATLEEIRQECLAPLHHAMLVTGRRRAVLSIFRGLRTHEWTRVEFDGAYGGELMDRALAFRRAVEADRPPRLPSASAPAPFPAFSGMRHVSMQKCPGWADAAHEWTANRRRARLFERAAETLRSLTDADVRLARGHGVTVRRMNDGRLVISGETEQDRHK